MAHRAVRPAFDRMSRSNPDVTARLVTMAPRTAPAIAQHVKLTLIGGEEVNYFSMSGADLKADAEGGDTLAAAEIARRKANRAAKSAARKAAAA